MGCNVRKKLFEDKIFLLLFILYFMGLIIGIMFNSKVDPKSINLSNIKFLKVFLTNYWYLIIIWLMGMSIIGLIFTPFIVFIRGLIFGTFLSVLIKLGFKQFFIYTVLDLLVMVPSTFILSYFSFKSSINHLFGMVNGVRVYLNMKNYVNLMVYVTIFIAVYSIILSIN